MELLIISATKLEIEPAFRQLKNAGANILISGVGAAPSVYSITKAVQQQRPQLMIQAGIGGCFEPALELGNVVAIAEDGFGDIGVLEQKKWQTVFDMGFVNPNKKPFKSGFLMNPHKKIIGMTGLSAVPAVTVNEITTQKERINLLRSRGMVIESMEGAALHYVALMEKIPFLQIRAVSNYVGERDKRKWNFADAIANLNFELLRIVDLLKKSN